MSGLKKYNLEGKVTGEITPDEIFTKAKANSQSIKDYIVAIRANARQWSASTKDRSEVNHSKKKPHPQKKTGRARQGSLASPQFKGGGVVFGPRPKFDQHVRINKKERRQAIRYLLAEKMNKGKAIILESTSLENPKTKIVAELLKSCGMESGRTLVLGDSSFSKEENKKTNSEKVISIPNPKHSNFRKSLNNLPKTSFSLASNVNAYDLANAQNIVITEEALPELKNWLLAK